MISAKHLAHFWAAVLALVFVQSPLRAQSVFQRTSADTGFNPYGTDYAVSIIQTADSGFIVAGEGSNRKPSLIKLSPSGDVLWQSSFPQTFLSVAALSSGVIVAAAGDNVLYAFSPSGSIILWHRLSDVDGLFSVIADGDTAIAISYLPYGGSLGRVDSQVIWWVASDGTVLSRTSLPGALIRRYVNNTYSTFPYRAIIKRSRDYLIASDTILFAIDRSGAILWRRAFPNGITGIRNAYSGQGFAVQTSPNQETDETSVILFDSSGTMLDSTGAAQGFAMTPTGLVTVGLSYTYPYNTRVGSSAFYNYGPPQSYRLNTYTPAMGPWRTGWNSLIDVTPTFDGGYAFAGLFGGTFSESPVVDGASFYVVKTDSLGLTDSLTYFNVPVSAAEVRPIPASESLVMSPNPTTGFVTLRGTESVRRVSMMNLLGMPIQSHFISPHQEAGELFLDLTQLPAGTYYLRIENVDGSSAMQSVIKE